MSTPIVFNSVAYSVPAYNDTGYAQGAGNLSSYLKQNVLILVLDRLESSLLAGYFANRSLVSDCS